eukprot:2903873-Alexandrium_andersonii.AAC.1
MTGHTACALVTHQGRDRSREVRWAGRHRRERASTEMAYDGIGRVMRRQTPAVQCLQSGSPKTVGRDLTG